MPEIKLDYHKILAQPTNQVKPQEIPEFLNILQMARYVLVSQLTKVTLKPYSIPSTLIVLPKFIRNRLKRNEDLQDDLELINQKISELDALLRNPAGARLSDPLSNSTSVPLGSEPSLVPAAIVTRSPSAEVPSGEQMPDSRNHLEEAGTVAPFNPDDAAGPLEEYRPDPLQDEQIGQPSLSDTVTVQRDMSGYSSEEEEAKKTLRRAERLQTVDSTTVGDLTISLRSTFRVSSDESNLRSRWVKAYDQIMEAWVQLNRIWGIPVIMGDSSETANIAMTKPEIERVNFAGKSPSEKVEIITRVELFDAILTEKLAQPTGLAPQQREVLSTIRQTLDERKQIIISTVEGQRLSEGKGEEKVINLNMARQFLEQLSSPRPNF